MRISAAPLSRPPTLFEEAIVAWYVADQRRSRAAATEIIGHQVVAENNYRKAAVRIAQDPECAGLDASRLVELVANHAHAGMGWYGNAQLETLAVLQPSHPLVQRAWTKIRKVIQYGPTPDAPAPDNHRPDVGDDDELHEVDSRSLHIQTYLAVAYACIRSEDVGLLVARDLHWMAQHGDELTYYESALVRHLRRRLRADPIAVQSLHAAAVRNDVPVHAAAQILSLLAASSPAGVSVREAISDCLNRVAD